MALLTKIIQVLPAAQRFAIKSLLAQRKKLRDIPSPRDELAEANRMLALVQSSLGKQIYSPIYAVSDTRISSEDHNHNMEGIYIDLNALYSEIEALAKAAGQRSAVLNSEYFKSRAAIEKLLNDARTFSLRKKYNQFNEVHIIDFNSARNVTTALPKAEIDPKVRLLELKPISSTRAHLVNRLSRITRVYTKTVGPGLKASLANGIKPEDMVDQKPETFWGSLVMTDVPVSQEYLGDKVNGPVVEIYLKFSHIEQLNVVRVLPFGEHPMKLIDISYRPNSTSEVFYSVGNFDQEVTLDWIEVNFHKILASELRISLAQENPKLVTYHLPRSLVVNTDLFEHIIKARAKIVAGSTFYDSDLARELLSQGDAYEDALEDLQDLIAGIDLAKSPIEEVDLTDQLVSALGLVLSTVDDDEPTSLITKDLIETGPTDSIIEIKRYEYLLGVREVEANYELYSPQAYYESPVYLPQATLSEIQIEVDQQLIESENSWGKYYQTSTEWSVDLGEGRIFPIHPSNLTGRYSLPAALDERLEFDRTNNIAYTRLGASTDNVLALRRNGVLVPKSGYTATRQTGNIPRIKIEVTGEEWSDNSIYTTDYEVSTSSTNLDILNLVQPRSLGEPETFSKMGPDNDVILSRFPFIRYEVIHRTGSFTKSANESVWEYSPLSGNFTSGQIRIYPTVLDSVNQILATGLITGFTDITGTWGSQSGIRAFNIRELHASYFSDPEGFGYYSQFMGIRNNSHITGTFTNSTWSTTLGKVGTTGVLFREPPKFTTAQLLDMPREATTGFDVTGANGYTGYINAEFILGIGLNIGGRVFAFDDTIYDPIQVTIGGKEAKNITDYQTLQHPAFSIASITDKEYQFIHAGRRLYFNQPVKDIEIKVDYEWLTEHLKLLGRLRCNKQISPDETPKVDEVRILMNTTTL